MGFSFNFITSLTGLVGTVGGVMISYLSLRHLYRKDRHEVKLEIAKANLLTPIPGSTKPDWSKDKLTFKLANVGVKEFTVTSIGLKLGKRSGGFYINQPEGTVVLPHNLKPDSTCDFWSDYNDLLKRMKKPRFRNRIYIRGYARDYIGNTFYSKKLHIYLKDTRLHKLRLKMKTARRDFVAMFFP